MYQLIGSLSIVCKALYIPGGCLGLLPSTVWVLIYAKKMGGGPLTKTTSNESMASTCGGFSWRLEF